MSDKKSDIIMKADLIDFLVQYIYQFLLLYYWCYQLQHR